MDFLNLRDRLKNVMRLSVSSCGTYLILQSPRCRFPTRHPLDPPPAQTVPTLSLSSQTQNHRSCIQGHRRVQSWLLERVMYRTCHRPDEWIRWCRCRGRFPVRCSFVRELGQGSGMSACSARLVSVQMGSWNGLIET